MLTEKLINNIIVMVQNTASAKYGWDNARTMEIVRNCDKELRSSSPSKFEAIKAKWLVA